jgi:hypothetical protein
MPELHTNGNYEGYLAQLFNPAVGGIPGIGVGGIPGLIPQGPAAAQGAPQMNGSWSQAQQPVHPLAAIQLAQQIVVRQAIQAQQCAQALQTLLQLTQVAPQTPFGVTQPFGANQPFGVTQPFGLGAHAYQAVHPQALQQLVQYLTMQPPTPFRYGMAV